MRDLPSETLRLESKALAQKVAVLVARSAQKLEAVVYGEERVYIAEIKDAKLHVPNKDCSDVFEIDPDSTELYGVATQFAEIVFSAFGGLRNKQINRYIPIESIRATPIRTIDDKVDVDRVIDERLAKDEERIQRLSSHRSDDDEVGADRGQMSQVFNNAITNEVDRRRELDERYDIVYCEDALSYNIGNFVEPQLAKSISKFSVFYNDTLNELKYRELLKTTATERCQFLAHQNRHLLLRGPCACP